jgi:hypothetical protein
MLDYKNEWVTQDFLLRNSLFGEKQMDIQFQHDVLKRNISRILRENKRKLLVLSGSLGKTSYIR